MSISYKTENGFTIITIASDFDGELTYKNGSISIFRCGGGGAGKQESASIGTPGFGGNLGNSGPAGAGAGKYNQHQYKGD